MVQNVKKFIGTKLTGNHNGFGVAPQAVLQQPGEDGVTVGDVSRPSAPAAARGRALHMAALPFTCEGVNALAAAEHLRILC